MGRNNFRMGRGEKLSSTNRLWKDRKQRYTARFERSIISGSGKRFFSSVATQKSHTTISGDFLMKLYSAVMSSFIGILFSMIGKAKGAHELCLQFSSGFSVKQALVITNNFYGNMNIEDAIRSSLGTAGVNSLSCLELVNRTLLQVAHLPGCFSGFTHGDGEKTDFFEDTQVRATGGTELPKEFTDKVCNILVPDNSDTSWKAFAIVMGAFMALAITAATIYKCRQRRSNERQPLLPQHVVQQPVAVHNPVVQQPVVVHHPVVQQPVVVHHPVVQQPVVPIPHIAVGRF